MLLEILSRWELRAWPKPSQEVIRVVASDVSHLLGVLKKAQLRWLLGQHLRGSWKWGGAIGAWILSPAQVDALNSKP